FVGNNVYRIHGFHPGSRDSLDAGLLCLGVARHRIGRWGFARMVVRALLGRLDQERDLDILVAKEIQIASRRRRLPVSIDGEIVSLTTPLHYSIRPGALRVIAP